MSILSWFSTDYLKGSMVLPVEEAQATYAIYGIKADIGKANVVALTEDNLRAFVWKYHDRDWFVYDQDSPDFPNCHDCAWVAVADIMRGSAKAFFPHACDFEKLNITRTDCRHALNVALRVKDDGTIGPLAYEPQNGSWCEVTDIPLLVSTEGSEL